MLKRGAFGLALIFGLWFGAMILFDPPSFLLPGPGAVLNRLAFLYEHGALLRHMHVTLMQVLWGFLIGFTSGVAAALIFAKVPLIERMATPLILMLQTVPKIAIAPLLLLWLGIGPGPKIVLVALVTFFPIMTGMLSGLKFVHKPYLDLAMVLKLSSWQRFWNIELPSSLPMLFAGASVATTLAMTAVLIGEFMGASQGMGFLLAAGQENGDTAAVIAMVLLLSLTGWFLFELFEALRRKMESRFSTL